MNEDLDLKKLLKEAAVTAKRIVPEYQLDEAVLLVRNTAAVRARLQKSDLEAIGKSVVGDATVFAATDMDTINNILTRTRGK